MIELTDEQMVKLGHQTATGLWLPTHPGFNYVMSLGMSLASAIAKQTAGDQHHFIVRKGSSVPTPVSNEEKNEYLRSGEYAEVISSD